MYWFICFLNYVTRLKTRLERNPNPKYLLDLPCRLWKWESDPKRKFLHKSPPNCYLKENPNSVGKVHVHFLDSFKTEAWSRGANTGGDTPQKWAQSRWHSLWSRVAMSTLHHGAGAYNPLHYKPPSIQCGRDWPIFLTVWDLIEAFPRGWWAPHVPMVAVCTPCRVFMASSENCLWAERPQGRLCYGVHSSVDNCIPGCRGRLRTVSQERQLPYSTTTCPSESAEPCSSRLAAENTWVVSSELRAEVTPATLCPNAGLGVLP